MDQGVWTRFCDCSNVYIYMITNTRRCPSMHRIYTTPSVCMRPHYDRLSMKTLTLVTAPPSWPRSEEESTKVGQSTVGYVVLIMHRTISVCIASHLGQLSLPTLRVGKSSTGLRLGLRRGVFTCVRWKVALRDPVRQVAFRISEMQFH